MLTENTRLARPTRIYAQLPRFQRVKVSLLGRYMLTDRREFPCQILEMSPGDAVVVAPVLRFADVGFNADVRITDLGDSGKASAPSKTTVGVLKATVRR